MSAKAHSSYLHGRGMDAAEILAGTREQFSPYDVHKKKKTLFFLLFFCSFVLFWFGFFCILHACPVSVQVVYLGACFSGINIYSKMLGFGSCAVFLPILLAVIYNKHSHNKKHCHK